MARDARSSSLHRLVRPVCSSGDSSLGLFVLGLIACIFVVVPVAICAVMCSSFREAWWVLWRCWGIMFGCVLLALLCAGMELRFAVARADRERERRRREDESNPCDDGTAPEISEPSASLKLKFGVCAFCGGNLPDDSVPEVGVGLPDEMGLASREKDFPKPEINNPK